MTAILLGTPGIYTSATTVLNTFYASVWAGGGGGGGGGDDHFGRDGGSGGRGGTGAFGEIKVEGLTSNHRLKFTVGSGGVRGTGGIGGNGGLGGGISKFILSDVDGTKNETLIAIGGGGGGGGGGDASSVKHGENADYGDGGRLLTSSSTPSAGGAGGDSIGTTSGDGGLGGFSFAVTDVVDGTYNSTVHSGVVVTLLAKEKGNQDGSYLNPVGDTNHFSVNNTGFGTGGAGGDPDGENGVTGQNGRIVYGFSSSTVTSSTTEITVDPTTLTGAE